MLIRKIGQWGRRAVIVSAIGCLVSCGGGSNADSGNNVGPNAILNGSTLATATTSWTASNCAVKVELTGDGGAKFAVSDESGITSSGTTTWSPLGSDGATIKCGSGIGGFLCLGSLAHISGSTASQAFTAAVTAGGSNGSQTLTCSFSLQNATLAEDGFIDRGAEAVVSHRPVAEAE